MSIFYTIILFHTILHIVVKGNISTTETNFLKYGALKEGKRSIEPKARYLPIEAETTGTDYPFEQAEGIPKAGKQREKHQSDLIPTLVHAVYESVIITNPTTSSDLAQTVTYSDEELRPKNNDEKTVLFSTVMKMNSQNNSNVQNEFSYNQRQSKQMDTPAKNLSETDIEKLIEVGYGFNEFATKLNSTTEKNHSIDFQELNRKILVENMGANEQNNTKFTNKKLIKLAMLLSKISWDILERHDDIKNMHKELIHTYFDFLKKKSEINKNITDFIKKQTELDNQKQHILDLESMLMEKQKKFEDRQIEFKIKEKEFENIQKRFLLRQHDFAKNQVYLTNKSEKIVRKQNDISLKQADIGASQATFAKLFKNAYKSPSHISQLSTFDKTKKDAQANYYDVMMKEIHGYYEDNTTEKPSRIPKNVGRDGNTNKKLENNKKLIQENIKIKNEKNKELSQKTVDYLETYDIDDLVYQRYFKNTSFDRIFRKMPLKKKTRSYRDLIITTPSIETLLENMISSNKEENSQNNTEKVMNSDLIEYMDMLTTEKSDSTNILDNIYDYLSQHVGKGRSKRNIKVNKEHRKHHKKAIRMMEKIRKNTFHRLKPIDHVKVNTSMDNESSISLKDSNSTNEQMIIDVKRYCNQIDQNSNEVTFNYCVEKALRRLQNPDTRLYKTDAINLESRQNKNLTVKDNSSDHITVVNSIKSSLNVNKIDMADYNDKEVIDDDLQINTEGTVYWDSSFYSKDDLDQEDGVSDKLPGDTSISDEKTKQNNPFSFKSHKKSYRKSANKDAWWKSKKRH